MPVLVAARFIQGLGAGAIPPIAYVAIGRSLPERLRPRMFATLSTAWVLPGVIGPAIAGVVGETFGWRCVFLGLLPLIVVAGVARPITRSPRSVVPEPRPRTNAAHGTPVGAGSRPRSWSTPGRRSAHGRPHDRRATAHRSRLVVAGLLVGPSGAAAA